MAARYELLLLAGTPQYRSALLPGTVERETTLRVGGGEWLVADVRERDGDVPLVVCIHAA